MKLINGSNETLEIKITGYHFKNSVNRGYNSDWLNVSLILKNDSETFVKFLRFLVIEEIERMQDWFKNILEKNIQLRELDFIDPCFRLKLMNRSGIQVIKFMYETDEKNRGVWEMNANNINIQIVLDELQLMLIKYPCRCGEKHTK